MKKVLAILYGIDDKFSLVKRSINNCHQYFDRIIIINTGGKYTADKLKTIICPIMEIYNQSFLWGDTDSSRRYAINLCDWGDWVFWLDSDECPTKNLLLNLNDIINEADNSELYNVRFPAVSHRFDNITGQDTHIYGNVYYENSQQNKEKFLSSDRNVTTAFIMNRLIKKNKNFYIYGNLGGHSQFAQYNDGWLYKNFLINHYKSEKTEIISIVLHTWATQCTNFPKYNDIKFLYSSEEYMIHENFKNDNNVKTSVDLVMRIKNDSSFTTTLKNVYCKEIFRLSKFHYSYYIDWIEKYNADVINDDGDFCCKLECCKY
jgi:hypothetical protein